MYKNTESSFEDFGLRKDSQILKNRSVIGNTPMVRIKYKYKNKIKTVFVKLEYFNLTGSIKDRVAFYIINNAIKKGILKENAPIVEATSGNTGISLSALGSLYKHPVYIFMPDWVSKERVKLMEIYGAKVFLISKEDGGFKKCVFEAEKFAKSINGFLANQFENRDNYLAHYNTTAEEIINQLSEDIGGFVSGIGTGGTLMGIGDRLRKKYPNITITAIEPDSMPLLSKGKIFGSHKIEGIGDEFIPKLVEKQKIDKVILVNDEDAINMSRKLSKELGIGVGISSGANLIGSVLLADEVEKNVVTVFADDNKKYLSTDLFKEPKENEQFISSKIELLSYD